MNANDIYFNSVWRMDWGLGNPNKTAALIAMLMIAVWALARLQKWGFWLAATLFTGLGICLIHTLSRGGLIAAGAGLLFLLWKSPRPWPSPRIIGITAAVWLIVGFSVYLQAHKRFGQGMVQEDRSITNRLEIWKLAPRMMVDAPAGWGFGNSGAAYGQWYQPVDQNEAYRTLVNSHLTWLVEVGWPLRFLYILCWLAIFFICWPSGKHRWFAVPMGVWIAFGVAATFSSVAESFWLWIPPALSLLAVLWARAGQQFWPTGRVWIGAAALSCTWVIILFAMGWMRGSRIEIHGAPGIVRLNARDPKTWIIINETVLGANYGKALRRFFLENEAPVSSVGVVRTVSRLPEIGGKTVVLAGAQEPGALAHLQKLNCKKLVLLNPPYYPQEIGISGAIKEQTEVFFGDFAQTPSRSAWKEILPIRNVEAAGDFLPAWTNLVFQTPSQPKPST